MRKLTLAAALLFALIACSGGSDSSQTTPPAPATTAAPESASPTQNSIMVAERNGLQDPRAVKWDTAVGSPDGMSVVVTWMSQPEECVGLDGTEVVYGGGSIAIDIIEGDVRRDEPCPPGQQVLKSTVITLEQPLQDRNIRPLSVL